MNIPPVPENGRFRVLVVEDDQNIARLVLTHLVKGGMECRYAMDGTIGLQAFEAAQPHLVLTDILMPGMNGIELCSRIREKSSVPIIIMTASDTDERQAQSLKCGADDYVAKPFNPRLLVMRVIANLRRVYHYDADAAVQKPVPVAASSTPTCDNCGFTGPINSFIKQGPRGESSLLCPQCGRTTSITFSVA